MNRKIEETKMVKDFLKTAGYDVKVRHGKGTSCGWLKIYVKSDLPFRELRSQICSIVQGITGRSGEYDGRINVFNRE